jgi:GNAT superfamily N-acetyltransferase
MADKRSQGVTIRAGQREDVGVILELIRGLAEYERLGDQVQATQSQLSEFLFGPRPAAETLLALDDQGKAVGFALYFTTFSTFVGKPGIFLEDLFVIPEARGKGYGKALIQAVAHVAVSRRCGRMEWSVLDWNQPSIDFYRSLGAVPMDDWTMYRLTGEPLEALGR